jgi:hypothetical protein
MSDQEDQEEFHREDSQAEEGDDDFLTQFRAVLDKLRTKHTHFMTRGISIRFDLIFAPASFYY